MSAVWSRRVARAQHRSESGAAEHRDGAGPVFFYPSARGERGRVLHKDWTASSRRMESPGFQFMIPRVTGFSLL